MIGCNGGLLGAQRSTNTDTAPGVWAGNEQVLLKRADLWPRLDADAETYITAVEAADGQALEHDVKIAIDQFVGGCKSDNIWTAIKACCILAGARTLSGALVPLVGTAPTNYNFVSGDYNRVTGLKGDGSTKYLDSNRNNNADPQNSKHLAVYNSIAGTGARVYTGGTLDTWVARDDSNYYTRVNSTTSTTTSASNAVTGFMGASRPDANTVVSRINNANTSTSRSSVAPQNISLTVFSQPSFSQWANDRLSFYSIGESIDLAKLDTRVTALVTAIGAAIA